MVAHDVTLTILASIAIFIFSCIYIPVLAFYAYRTKIYEHHTVMAKRHNRLTILLSLLSIAWILSLIVHLCVLCWRNDNVVLHIFANFAVLAIYISFTYTLIWRLYCIHLTILRCISHSHLSWQQMIDVDVASNLWLLSPETRSRSDPTFIRNVMLTCVAVNVALLLFLIFVPPFVSVPLRVLLVVTPWVFIARLYNKLLITKLHDDIGIATEIRVVLIGYVVMGVCFLSIVFAIPAINGAVAVGILYNLCLHLVALSAFATSMMMTAYTLRKYVYPHAKSSAQPRGVRSVSNQPLNGNRPRVVLKLSDVCVTMFGLDLFMKVLEREYSRENLLFVVEVTLLQKAILEHYTRNQSFYDQQQQVDVQRIVGSLFVLPATCPSSSIVEHVDESVYERYRGVQGQIMSQTQREQIRFKHAICRLYEKYIAASSSELTVNISYFARLQIASLVRDETAFINNKEYNNIERLIGLYEPSKNEVIRLIRSDSIPRFRNTPEYQRIVELMQNVKERIEEQKAQNAGNDNVGV